MRARSSHAASAAIALATLLALAGACHKPPAEHVAEHDAGAATATGPSLAPWIAPDAATDGAKADAGDGPLKAFCSDVFAADSAKLLEKCPAKELSFARGLARAASNLCTDDVNAASARGRMTFDPDAAKRCIEMLAANDKPRASMNDTLFLHYPCDRVLLGVQAEGQPCRFSVECGDGLACVGYKIGVDGACKKPPKAGEACTGQRFGSIWSEEAAALHHPACNPAAYCASDKCEPRSAQGKPCASTAACTAGLSCVMGKCGSLSQVGGGCFASSECVLEAWCDHPSATTPGKCVPKRPAGADCPQIDACRGRCDLPKGDGGAPPVGKCFDVCGSG